MEQTFCKKIDIGPNKFLDEKVVYFFESTCPFDESKLRHGIGIKEKLYCNRSKYQKVEIFDTFAYGRMLVLDGIVQTSEADEFIYHESIVHLPMFYHSDPKKVLIVGGGDGGTLREALRHPVEKVWMVEIDKKVIESCKKYIPSIPGNAYEDERGQVIVGDGKKYVEQYKNFFDVVILDLSDPHGPAEGLISENFYQSVKRALKSDGIVSIQSESLTYQPKLVKKMQKRIKNVFSSVKMHCMSIPTYQGGLFSLTVASSIDLDGVEFDQKERRYKKLNLN